MAIVVDANLVAGLALPAAYNPLAAAAFKRWTARGERLIAPMLLEFELTTIVRRSVTTGNLRPEAALTVLRELQALAVETIVPTPELHERALALAERIGHSKAYHSQFLALAERENAEFWTADRRLATAAHQAGLTWVHWIGESDL